MSTTNIHFTPIKSSKSLAETRTLNAGTSELIPKKKRLKFPTLHSTFLPFSHKKILILSTLESSSLDETIRYASKWFILIEVGYRGS